MREVLTVTARREGDVIDDVIDEELRDLVDHVVTVHEEIEMSRRLLVAALEGHMSVVSNRLNEVVLKVSAWAAIIAVPTVIASIYGMNFATCPSGMDVRPPVRPRPDGGLRPGPVPRLQASALALSARATVTRRHDRRGIRAGAVHPS